MTGNCGCFHGYVNPACEHDNHAPKHEQNYIELLIERIRELEKRMCEFPQLGEVEFAVEVHKRRIRELEAERDHLKYALEEAMKHSPHGYVHMAMYRQMEAERDRYRKALENTTNQCRYWLKTYRSHTGAMNATHLSEKEMLEKSIIKAEKALRGE